MILTSALAAVLLAATVAAQSGGIPYMRKSSVCNTAAYQSPLNAYACEQTLANMAQDYSANGKPVCNPNPSGSQCTTVYNGPSGCDIAMCGFPGCIDASIVTNYLSALVAECASNPSNTGVSLGGITLVTPEGPDAHLFITNHDGSTPGQPSKRDHVAEYNLTRTSVNASKRVQVRYSNHINRTNADQDNTQVRKGLQKRQTGDKWAVAGSGSGLYLELTAWPSDYGSFPLTVEDQQLSIDYFEAVGNAIATGNAGNQYALITSIGTATAVPALNLVLNPNTGPALSGLQPTLNAYYQAFPLFFQSVASQTLTIWNMLSKPPILALNFGRSTPDGDQPLGDVLFHFNEQLENFPPAPPLPPATITCNWNLALYDSSLAEDDPALERRALFNRYLGEFNGSDVIDGLFPRGPSSGNPRPFKVYDQSGPSQPVVMYTASYPNGGNGQSLNEANGRDEAFIAASDDCSDVLIVNNPSVVGQAPPTQQVQSDHVWDLNVFFNFFLKFAQTRTLDTLDGRGEIQRTQLPALPFNTIRDNFAQPYDFWENVPDAPVGSPLDAVNDAHGSTSNPGVMENLESTLNSVKGRMMYTLQQPTSDSRFQALLTGNNLEGAVSLVRAVFQVFEYMNADTSHQNLISIFSGVQAALAAFDHELLRTDASSPTSTALYQAFIPLWLDRVENQMSAYITRRLQQINDHFSPYTGGGPLQGLAISATRYVTLYGSKMQSGGLKFNRDGFLSSTPSSSTPPLPSLNVPRPTPNGGKQPGVTPVLATTSSSSTKATPGLDHPRPTPIQPTTLSTVTSSSSCSTQLTPAIGNPHPTPNLPHLTPQGENVPPPGDGIVTATTTSTTATTTFVTITTGKAALTPIRRYPLPLLAV